MNSHQYPRDEKDFYNWTEREAREDDAFMLQRARGDDASPPDKWRTPGDAFLHIYKSPVGNTESAIEQMLGEQLPKFAEKCGYQIIPQYELGPFRYDFAIKNRDGNVVAVIECDGLAFHSSPEQRARDAAKNELAKKEGLLMQRFTGKEICEDTEKCAKQVIFWVWPR